MALNGNGISAASHFEKQHAFILSQTANGDVANFQETRFSAFRGPALVHADFVRDLLLGLISGAQVQLPGIRIQHARIIGGLDLTDCMGAGGQGLPALALEHCELPDKLDLRGARLARVSIKGSRFRAFWGTGLVVDGDFDCREARPLPWTAAEHHRSGEPTAYIRLRAARISGDLRGRGAILRPPDEKPPGMREAPRSLSGRGLIIGGSLSLDLGFKSYGTVMLAGAHVKGNVDCIGGSFQKSGGEALNLRSARIGGAVLLRRRFSHPYEEFEAEGEVSLADATIGSGVECESGRFKNTQTSEKFAILARNATIGGDVRFCEGFVAEGRVTLYGARIAGSLTIANATFENADDWALVLNGLRVEGPLYAEDNTVKGSVSLTGATLDTLYDDPLTAWEGADAINQNELTYQHLSVAPEEKGKPKRRQLWKDRRDLLKRNTNVRVKRSVSTDNKTEGAELKLLSVASLLGFSNQPWRECAAALERGGKHGDARHIAREGCREENRRRPLWLQPFFYCLAETTFGYGLSATRATVTLLVFFLVGWVGAEIMLARGVLIPTDVDETRPCLELLTPPVYAADVAIPLLDLRQETECRAGISEDAQLFPGFRLLPSEISVLGVSFDIKHRYVLEEVAVWRWAKGIYSIFGAVFVGFALLTYSGVYQPKAHR